MTQPSPRPTSSRRLRRVLGVVAVATGVLLVVLERRLDDSSGGGGSCFWLVVAGLLIVLGIVELLDRGSPRPNDRSKDLSE